MCVHATQYGTKYHTNYQGLHLHQSHHLANKYIRLHQIAVNYMTNHTNPYKSCISVYLSANMYTQIHTNHTSFKQDKSQFRWCHQFHILHVISFWVLRPGSNLSGITLTLKETTNKTESFWVYLQHIFLYIIIYVHVFFLWCFCLKRFSTVWNGIAPFDCNGVFEPSWRTLRKKSLCQFFPVSSPGFFTVPFLHVCWWWKLNPGESKGHLPKLCPALFFLGPGDSWSARTITR